MRPTWMNFGGILLCINGKVSVSMEILMDNLYGV